MDGTIGVLTLSDLMGRLQQDASLSSARARDLVSAVQRVCEISGIDPHAAPASLHFMRPFINAVRPAKHGLKLKTWSNLRSNFRAAVLHASPRLPRKADPDWERLRSALPDAQFRSGLSRFISFCERERISPPSVSDEVLARFRDFLEVATVVTHPAACFRRTCCLWNRAVERVQGWPRVHVSLPDHRRVRQSIPLSEFPASLLQEVESYLALPSADDRFAKDALRIPRRPATIRRISVEIELAASALVAAGWKPNSVTSLRCLVEPEAAEAILRRYLTPDGKPRPIAHNLASTLIALATRLAGSDPIALENLAKLKWLRRCLGPQKTGLTEKNRILLRAFDAPVVRERWLCLPQNLAAYAEKAKPRHGAVSMGLAVAIAILQAAPLRIANLAALRLDRHLTRPGGSRSLWQIDIPPHEVKNDVALAYELPSCVTAMLDRYVRKFRPLLASPGNPYLFPAAETHKGAAGLSQQIRRVIASWIGIDMTPHQFRHCAGRLMQQHSPGAFAAIAHLLGHKHVETAQVYYAEIDTLAVGRQFDAILEAERVRARLPSRRQL